MNCKKAILDLLKRTKAIESINEVQAFIEDVNSKLDKLVSGTNIKTINGQSILGLGNLNTKSYHTFSNSWNTSTITNLCNSMVNDSDVEAGMAYYGKFTGTGLPSGLGQAEMIIEVIANDVSNGKSLHLSVFSADTSPYKWEAQYVKINGNYPSTVTWRLYLTLHQDISGKEDKSNIVAPVNTTDATLPITTLSCEVGKYYKIDVAVDTLTVTLPAVTDTTHISNIVFMLTTGSTPAVTFTAPSGINVYYQDGFEIEAGSTYEINALFNGAAWIVAAVKINTSNS